MSATATRNPQDSAIRNLDRALLLETLLAIRTTADPVPLGMAVRPIWSDRVSGRRASPYLRPDLTLLEQLEIDRATLEFASQGLMIDSGVLVTPISFEVASSSRGRAMLSDWMEAHSNALSSRIIFELVHLNAGTPRGRLQEIASALTARSARLMARAEPSRAMLALLRDCRVGSVSLDCSGTAPDDLPKLLKTFGNAAKPVAPVLCVLGLPDIAAAGAARAAGFSHATVNSG